MSHHPKKGFPPSEGEASVVERSTSSWSLLPGPLSAELSRLRAVEYADNWATEG